MFELKLLNNNSEVIPYKYEDFLINSNEFLLSDYPNMAASNHWHDEFEFNIILEGRMAFSINGKNHELNEGQAIFINSEQLHYGYSINGADCKFICILLNPSLVSKLNSVKEDYIIPICKDSAHPFFIFNKSVNWQREFIETLVKIHNLFINEEEGFQLQLMSSFYNICYTLFNNVKNEKPSEEYYYDKNLKAMHNMIGYIQKNYKNKITLKEIASAGNVCRSSSCEIFQSISNKSPITYVVEYRLNKSISMLSDPSYSITEIALQCGFNSSSYFTEIFHRNMGCTPSEYRKMLINKGK